MQFKKTKNRLEVKLSGDFNLNTMQKISEKLDDRDELTIDLKRAHFVNSKSTIFMHNLMHRDPPVTLRLKNPPKVFFELLSTLGLQHVWNLDEIIEP